MSVKPSSPSDHVAWAGDRHILVPPDIVAVPRRSPVRARKRTPWHPQPEGVPNSRAGGREWFSDHLFVEPNRAEIRAAYSTSMTAHASCLIGLVVVALAQSDPIPVVRVGPSLVMPAMVAMVPGVGEALVPAAAPRVSEPAVRPLATPAAMAPPSVPRVGAPASAPLETPADIALETGNEGGVAVKSGGNVTGGIDGGIGGGTVSEAPEGRLNEGSSSVPAPEAPLRLRPGIEPPRKIKDVKPIYPQGALADKAGGTVIVEATVGIDGKVEVARVVRSVALLDEAALDAVRQWEFHPARLNGMPVAVIITVVVNFAIF